MTISVFTHCLYVHFCSRSAHQTWSYVQFIKALVKVYLVATARIYEFLKLSDIKVKLIRCVSKLPR